MLKNVMHDYLNENNIFRENYNLLPVLNVVEDNKPISINSSEWLVTKKNAMISYSFERRIQKEAFVIELLKYIRESAVDIEFSVRSKTVSLNIHSLSPYLSELEYECIEDIKKIKKDVLYYYAKK